MAARSAIRIGSQFRRDVTLAADNLLFRAGVETNHRSRLTGHLLIYCAGETYISSRGHYARQAGKVKVWHFIFLFKSLRVSAFPELQIFDE